MKPNDIYGGILYTLTTAVAVIALFFHLKSPERKKIPIIAQVQSLLLSYPTLNFEIFDLILSGIRHYSNFFFFLVFSSDPIQTFLTASLFFRMVWRWVVYSGFDDEIWVRTLNRFVYKKFECVIVGATL